jgi:hypothetical protein
VLVYERPDPPDAPTTTRRGYAKTISKPPSNAYSTRTGSTSSISAPSPNVVNTSQPDRHPSQVEGSHEKPSTSACGRLGSVSTAPSRLLPRPFQPPSETCLPSLPSSFRDPSDPLPRPVRSPPYTPRGRNRARKPGSFQARPYIAKAWRSPPTTFARPSGAVWRSLHQSRIGVLQAVTKKGMQSGSRGTVLTRGASDGRPAPQPTLFTLIIILN